MKVELSKSNSSIDMNNLGIGETGIITNGSANLWGHVVLRTYSGYVDLSDPEYTWPLNQTSMRVERKEFKLIEV